MDGANRLADVVGLANSRFPELSLLLESEPPCGPPISHVRKRANAHARRHRSCSKEGKGIAPPSRKRRRRPDALLATHNPHRSLSETNNTNLWLETHIWHAKRMHMRNIWGWTLPGNRSDMGCVAAIRAAQQRATLHDSTYQSPIEVCCSIGELMKVLLRLGDPHCSFLMGSEGGHDPMRGLRILGGHREVDTVLYRNGFFPRGIIAPIKLLLDPVGINIDDGDTISKQCDEILASTQQRTAWIFCHPSTLQQIRLELQSAINDYSQGMDMEKEDVEELDGPEGGVVRFEVRGRQASRMLQRVGILPANPPQLQHDGDIFGVRVCDPRHIRFGGSSPQFKRGWTQQEYGDWVARRRQQRGKRANNSEDHDVEASEASPRCVSLVHEFWGQDRFKCTLAFSQLKDHHINESIHNSRENGVPYGDMPILKVPCLVILRRPMSENDTPSKSTHQVSGWDLLLPAGTAAAFFHALVMAGCCALGLDEASALRSDHGLTNFPQDFPDSSVGHELWLQRRQGMKQKTKARMDAPSKVPPHCEVNWSSLFPSQSSTLTTKDVPSVMVARSSVYISPLLTNPMPSPPFSILIPVRVRMTGRGVPRCSRAVCLPLHDTTLLPLKTNSDYREDRTLEDEVEEEEHGDDARIPSIPKLELVVIGFMTSGSFSTSRGCGFGIGLVSVPGLQLLTTRQLKGQDAETDSPFSILQKHEARAVVAAVEQTPLAPTPTQSESTPPFRVERAQLSAISDAEIGLIL